MSRLFSSSVLALTFLIGGCATTPYSVGAAPSGASLAHYQSGRPTLISRAKTGVVEITPIASEFEDRIVLAVTAINTGVTPVNFGYENIGAIYQDGGAANLVPVQVLQREARERIRLKRAAPDGAASATNYGVDATAIIDSYGRPVAPDQLGVLRTTTIDPRNMLTGLIVLEKPWLNDRVRTLTVNVDLGGEAHAFRLVIARRGVLLPLGGVAAAARYDTAEGLQTLPSVPSLSVRPPSRPTASVARKASVQVARLEASTLRISRPVTMQDSPSPSPSPRLAAKNAKAQVQRAARRTIRQTARLDPYARPQIDRGVIE